MPFERNALPTENPLGSAADLELPEDASTSVTPLEDGGVEVDLDAGPDQTEVAAALSQHDVNLVDHIGEDELKRIGDEVYASAQDDLKSRDQWADLITKGLEELGLKIEEASEPFEGACTATHPLLIENVVKFQAKAAAELLPPAGPVKTRIYGKVDEDKEAKANRIKEFMNWQCMEQMVEYVDEKERMLFALSLIGTAITKTYYDASLDRPICEYIPIDQFVVAYNARDLRSAERFTHIITRTQEEFDRDVADKVYADVGLLSAPTPQPNVIQQKVDELVGQEPPATYRAYTLYEQHRYMNIEGLDEGNGFALPYIVTIDADTQKVVSIRRGWAEGDPKFARLDWFTRYVFVPGMSFYGLGLLHLIGSLAKGATASLRSLIDSGMFANLQGGFKLRGMKVVGNNDPIAPGEWKDVEATVSDISKAVMPLPFKEPSQTLFALLQFVVAAGQKFADTAEQVIADSTNYGPVGTTLALLEASTKFFSAIHKRLHASMKQELKILRRIDKDFLPNAYPYDVEGGQRNIFKSDFSSDIDVVPASDPNTPSNAHRLTKATTILTMAQQAPQLYDVREAHRQALVAMEAENIDKLMPAPVQPQPLDPLSDIQAASTGKPIAAFPGQNHDAHIAVKQAFLSDPMSGASQAFAAVAPSILANIREHMVLKYVEMANMQVQQAAQSNPQAAQQLQDPNIQAQIQAQAAQQVASMGAQQAQAQAAQMQGTDPAIALGMAELQQRQVEHKDNLVVKAAELHLRDKELEVRLEGQKVKDGLDSIKLGHQMHKDKQQRNDNMTLAALDHIVGALESENDHQNAMELEEVRAKNRPKPSQKKPGN